MTTKLSSNEIDKTSVNTFQYDTQQQSEISQTNFINLNLPDIASLDSISDGFECESRRYSRSLELL